MSPILPRINAGLRIRHVRFLQGMSQEELSDLLGFEDRQRISDIEMGRRAVSVEDLLPISEALGHPWDFFIDPFSVVVEAQVCWRASPELTFVALEHLERQRGPAVGMLRWLREKKSGGQSPLKFTLRVSPEATFEQLQCSAEALASQLNLGLVPSENLLERIERVLDIPVLHVDLTPGLELPAVGVTGASYTLEDLGVILLSQGESPAQRAVTLAYALFNLLTWDVLSPGYHESAAPGERQSSRRGEQLSDHFAMALLMPRESLNAMLDLRKLGDVEHLVDVACRLGVTPAALGWRLFSLGLIDVGLQAALKQRLVPAPEGSMRPLQFSLTMVSMLHTALDTGALSARKAAKVLGLSLSELTQLFISYGMPAPFEL
jgi:transcriptional regulator with XRE-family HTH domain